MNYFFYIMVLTHNGKVGFGITGNVHNRIFDYIAGSAELQSFKYLYYGTKADITDIEKKLKSEWKRHMWKVFKGNKWTLEILDKDSGLTAEDIQEWVNKKIVELKLPVRIVKDEWLPYQGDKRVKKKYIDLSPDMYLEA